MSRAHALRFTCVFLRRPLNSFSLQGLLLVSVATAGLGVVGIMAYLAHQGMLSPGLGWLGFGPVGGAIALAWVTAHRLRLQVHRLQQQHQLCKSNLRKKRAVVTAIQPAFAG